MLWHKLPKSTYFRRGAISEAVKDLIGKQRALIVTDRFLFTNGHVDGVIDLLKQHGMEVEVFYDVSADPTLSAVKKGVERANSFKPDLIVAFGGGSPMDAAKIIWVQYEHPEVHFQDLALRFMGHPQAHLHLPEDGHQGGAGRHPDHLGHRLGSHPRSRS